MIDEKTQFIEEIDELLTEAICENDEEKKLKFLQLAKLKGEKFLTCFPNDADASHMMGIVVYDFPGYEKIFLAEKYFADAVEKNPYHQFAKMYLGHCYFDSKRFSEALSCFEKIDEDYFISDDLIWRIIKLHELILCCKIYINQTEKFLVKFRQFIDEVNNEPQKTPDEYIPIPYEFAIALADTRSSSFWQSVNRESIVREFMKVLEKLNYEDTLKEYIERF